MYALESRSVLTDLSWDLVTLTVFNLDLSFFSALRLKIWNSEGKYQEGSDPNTNSRGGAEDQFVRLFFKVKKRQC